MNNNNFKTRKSALYVTLSENKDLKTAMMVLDKTGNFGSDKTICMRKTCDIILKELNDTLLEDWEVSQLSERFGYLFFNEDSQDNLQERKSLLEDFSSKYQGDGAKKLLEAFTPIAVDAIDKRRITSNFSKMDSKLLMTESTSISNAKFNPDNAIINIYDICENAFDNYHNLKNDRLFVILAESLTYLYNKNLIPMDEETIIEHITDWALLSEKCSKPGLAKGLKNLKSDKKDKAIKKVNKINQVAVPEKDKDDKPLLEFQQYDVKKILDDAMIVITGSKTVQEADIALKKTINLLYRVPKESILEEYPFILGFARRVILYGGSFLVNPLFVVPVIIVDVAIHQHVNLKNSDELLITMEKEKQKLEKRKETAKNKDKIQGYIDVLDKQIDRINTYKSGLTSDFEKDMRASESTDIMKEMATVLAYEEEIFTETGAVKTALIRTRENLKKNTEKLSAKEKAMSRNLDSNIEKFQRELESAAAVKERERVIEGKILPSASKTIKLAIGIGAAWAVNPAIAVIGAIAGIALSAKANARERQLVLDDIEVHLRIVEKKIQQAEMNNDDKALEQLLKLERTLTREKQRIKYRMKVYYNQRT